MRFQIMLVKDKRVVFETKDIMEVREWILDKTVVGPDGCRYPEVAIVCDGDLTDVLMSALSLDGTCEPLVDPARARGMFPLRGGPKDGHIVTLPRRKDGSYGIPLHRLYKVRGGKTAAYAWDDDRGCYQFAEYWED